MAGSFLRYQVINMGDFYVYAYLDPRKEGVFVTNLKKFCENNDLHYSNMRKVTCGLIDSYKGWKLGKPKRRYL